MSKSPEVGLLHMLWLGLALAAGGASADTLGLGRPALAEEIAAWDLDVRPDGTGLPPGSGDVLTGEGVFAEKCATCHGDFGEGVGNWPEVAGGQGTLANKDPVKTVGSYWPYLSTLWDYVHRSMPYGAAQTLSPDEVYAIAAYILYSNDIVDEEFSLNATNFTGITMPNADGFVVDDRAVREYDVWRVAPCMAECKDSVTITMRATALDVTPRDDVATAAPVDLIAKGQRLFSTCKSCHEIGEGAKNRSGPMLTGIVGRAAGAVDGFRYSKALIAAAGDGLIWDERALDGFLAAPRDYLNGSKMVFAGITNQEDRKAVIAYLKSHSAQGDTR
ncbi:c-type cytochrome [Marinovum sp. 2_MG-2023]|uniref:c-type cytochrome n=1 Tax=unclassified Marinovum TaxID=2647166 RepID=UPI0026E2F865|nr:MULTISPECIES: c-type cytochrome [unclassified Marinovum]MDO6730642.1 c-type cytochrome [Marinovum sp. 2_MG-2023]MDO6778793.1 c-type cytochrome [Marinovum sp. 1_MG-2023]